MDFQDRQIARLERKIEDLELALSEVTGRCKIPPAGFEKAKKEVVLIDLLAFAAPRAPTRQAILSAIYPYGKQPIDKIIDVFVCRARKRLMGQGVTIENVRGLGYRLSLESAERWREMTAESNPQPEERAA